MHDVDHNGLNNSFHINSQSPLAVLYNDISVLENHHCSFANKLLGRTENNIFANMEAEEQQRARARMIDCVLSTDMSTHFDVTNKFKLLVDSKQFHKGMLRIRCLAATACLAAWLPGCQLASQPASQPASQRALSVFLTPSQLGSFPVDAMRCCR